jgi:hypothetical protein
MLAAVPLKCPPLKCTPNFLDVIKGKIKPILFWTRILVPAFLFIAWCSLKVISGGITEMGWCTIMHEPNVLLNIQ